MKSFGQKSWMLPQPVLIIGTYDKNGKPNAMNAAWGGQWDAKEIMIAMGAHATTDNLNNCPDFTVAFATKQTMVAADFVGIVSAKNDADKMAKAGRKCEKSENVNAPVFTDFPMTLECRIKEKIDESEEGYYIVAEIVNILVDENYLAEDGKPDTERPSLISLAVTATFIWKVANPLYIDVRLVAHGQIHQPEKVNQGTCPL
ncbi:flavin reductase family protein [Prevotella sp. P5-92]|uniref:flavin reductase family protein n=1 Tax=Prevotella sp. P5-92 TaxID=2024222 RepID=UPI0020B12290|nr:flavin reductase [Prevotella sp. P5-92]